MLGYLGVLFERLRATDTMLEIAIRRNPDGTIGKDAAAASPSLETALYKKLDAGEGGPWKRRMTRIAQT